MKGLPLKLDGHSVELLADHSNLIEQRNVTKEEIDRIEDTTSNSQFSHLNLSVDYVNELNEIASDINKNRQEVQSLTKQAQDANLQIAKLQQRSKNFSIALIVAAVILLIVILSL